MVISEKNGSLKKNRYIHLATLTASLAFTHVSDVNGDSRYVSPKAAHVSAENCAIPVGCEIINALAGEGGRNK